MKKRTLFAILLLAVTVIEFIGNAKFVFIMTKINFTLDNMLMPRFILRLVQSIFLFICCGMMFAKAKDKTIIKTLSVYFMLTGAYFAARGILCLSVDENSSKSFIAMLGIIGGLIYIIIAILYIITGMLGIFSVKDKPRPVLIGLFLFADVTAKFAMENSMIKPLDFFLFIVLCGIYFYSSKNIYNQLKQLQQSDF